MAHAHAKSVSDDDAAIGARIRLRRKDLGITQSDLAQVLGLTFQQVQKYERGVNRIAAGRLSMIASRLQTSVGQLLGIQEDGTPAYDAHLAIWLAEPGALELLETYRRLTSAQRKAVRSVVRALDCSDPDQQAHSDGA